MPQPLPLLELWFSALNEPVGIIVTSTNRPLLIQKLYKARAEYSDPEVLAGLSICTSPTTDTEIWIVHKVVKVVPEPQGDVANITIEDESNG